MEESKKTQAEACCIEVARAADKWMKKEEEEVMKKQELIV